MILSIINFFYRTTINESSIIENISINDEILIPENEKKIFRADAVLTDNSNNEVIPDKKVRFVNSIYTILP